MCRLMSNSIHRQSEALPTVGFQEAGAISNVSLSHVEQTCQQNTRELISELVLKANTDLIPKVFLYTN